MASRVGIAPFQKDAILVLFLAIVAMFLRPAEPEW
jgi:hypothetical protein